MILRGVEGLDLNSKPSLYYPSTFILQKLEYLLFSLKIRSGAS